MSKQRRFNSRRFFDGFTNHESELISLFQKFGQPIPQPFTTEIAAMSVTESVDLSDPLMRLLYQLDDLASKKGREILEAAAERLEISDECPKVNVTNQRAALWLWGRDENAFNVALDRLAASGVQGGVISMFPGKSARSIMDPRSAAEGFEAQLNASIAEWNGAERFTIRHYVDGTMLVILVFCERTAEVRLEMESDSNSVRPRIGKPVIQDVLFYDQLTGELEIEASHAKQREVLRHAFAVGVMGDDSFFPVEERTRVLDLQRLFAENFQLKVRDPHQAKVTAITLGHFVSRHPFTSILTANRQDVIKMLKAKNAAGLLNDATIKHVRIELTLGSGRLDRKSIELSGDNRIKFNRASHADEVYRYLRFWQLMGDRELEAQSAA